MGMIILTYHRIGKPVNSHDLFTVPIKSLTDQLDLVKDLQFNFPAPQQLASGGISKNDCYVTFDDATADHKLEVAPKLEERGLHGIFFVPTATLGRSGRLNDKDCAALTAAGHLIGSHSHEHRRLDVMPPCEVAEQLEISSRILTEITGSPPRLFAPPGGYINAVVRAAASANGFTTIRTMKWGDNRRVNPMNLEAIPVHTALSLEALERILRGRGLLGLRLLYAAKELAKRLMPIKLYERCRERALS